MDGDDVFVVWVMERMQGWWKRGRCRCCVRCGTTTSGARRPSAAACCRRRWRTRPWTTGPPRPTPTPTAAWSRRLQTPPRRRRTDRIIGPTGDDCLVARIYTTVIWDWKRKGRSQKGRGSDRIGRSCSSPLTRVLRCVVFLWCLL